MAAFATVRGLHVIDAPASQHGVATTAATRPFVRPRAEPEIDSLGPYRLYERLGMGGHASVYRARRIGEPDACDIALKRLHPHLANDNEAVRAFGREARLAHLLDHPVIRRVYSLGRERGELFITMEYIDGVSVFDVLRRASAARCHLPLSGILALLHRLCGALHYAHGLVDEHGAPAGLVHRDVSPSNLVIATGGRLKLIDLGVATSRIDEQSASRRGLKGKYGYMAPEILERTPCDHRADVFSVGVVAWELLTLCRLYPVSKPPVDLEVVRSRPVAAPSTLNPGCPAELDAIVARALERDPAARWPSCAALADAITALAIRLRESVCDTAIADLVELAEDLGTRPRLARGTSPPTPAVVPRFEPDPVPAPAPARRCGRALAIGWVGGALTMLVVAGFTSSRIEPPEPVAPVAPPAPVRVAIPPPRAPVAAPPAAPIAPPPRAAAPRLPSDAPPVRIAGAPPRSWSVGSAYRARLCIDADGTVRSVAVLEGTARLETRIVRALQRWRYAPVARATCFEVRDHVEKVPGR